MSGFPQLIKGHFIGNFHSVSAIFSMASFSSSILAHATSSLNCSAGLASEEEGEVGIDDDS